MALRFVIIGGGPGGNTAATHAARLGAEVTMIEQDVVGGAAHLWDCIPSKAMIATGGALAAVGRTPEMGLTEAAAAVDPEALKARIAAIEERLERGTRQLLDSQGVRIIHGRGRLVGPHDVVADTVDGYPADGVLKAGDEILTVDGTAVDSLAALSALLAAKPAGSSYEIGIRRDGADSTVTLTTKADPDNGDRPIIGISPGATYDFPFPVTVNLGDVGGPSAGTMLALGIYDKLTPGALTGGERFAGTGTITADGVVGPIGGIRQKMYGAQRAGAEWFLAPKANCDEVVGHIPAGLQVFAMTSLDDAIDIVQTVADGGDTSTLATCGG